MNKKKIAKAAAAGITALAAGYFASKAIAENRAEKVRRELNVDNPNLRNSEPKNKSMNFYEASVKDRIDSVMAYCGIVALSPVLLGVSAAIYLDDPGPVFFKQKRIGKNKEYFELYKFRSMKMSTPHDMPTHMLSNPDQYITRVGSFLRKSSLDELPQLLNIFMPQMSVIGPRPALWNQDDLIAERDKYNANDVKPGLTGLAQISGRDELEIDVKAKIDGDYVKALKSGSLKALAMDIKCFTGTISSVLRHDGVVEGGTGEMAKKSAKK